MNYLKKIKLLGFLVLFYFLPSTSLAYDKAADYVVIINNCSWQVSGGMYQLAESGNANKDDFTDLSDSLREKIVKFAKACVMHDEGMLKELKSNKSWFSLASDDHNDKHSLFLDEEVLTCVIDSNQSYDLFWWDPDDDGNNGIDEAFSSNYFDDAEKFKKAVEDTIGYGVVLPSHMGTEHKIFKRGKKDEGYVLSNVETFQIKLCGDVSTLVGVGVGGVVFESKLIKDKVQLNSGENYHVAAGKVNSNQAKISFSGINDLCQSGSGKTMSCGENNLRVYKDTSWFPGSETWAFVCSNQSKNIALRPCDWIFPKGVFDDKLKSFQPPVYEY